MWKLAVPGLEIATERGGAEDTDDVGHEHPLANDGHKKPEPGCRFQGGVRGRGPVDLAGCYDFTHCDTSQSHPESTCVAVDATLRYEVSFSGPMTAVIKTMTTGLIEREEHG